MWRMNQEGCLRCLTWLRFPVWSARYINVSLREFASVESSLLSSETSWLLIIFRHESSECLCGPGAAGGSLGPNQSHAAPMRLCWGRGGCSGRTGLPQRPARSRLQVHPEQNRGHQGHGYGASVGPFLVQGEGIRIRFGWLNNKMCQLIVYSHFTLLVSQAGCCKKTNICTKIS